MTDYTRNVLARLISHWPTIGGDAHDPAAQVRITDWKRVIRLTGDLRADEVATELITTHDRSTRPGVGDWQAAARTVAARIHHQQQLERPRPIAAPRNPDIGARGIALCREALANATPWRRDPHA